LRPRCSTSTESCRTLPDSNPQNTTLDNSSISRPALKQGRI
jgi:hypothetical protein